MFLLIISDELELKDFQFSSAGLVTFSLQLENFSSARKSENMHFLSNSLFLSVCFHEVRGILLEPTQILFKIPYFHRSSTFEKCLAFLAILGLLQGAPYLQLTVCMLMQVLVVASLSLDQLSNTKGPLCLAWVRSDSITQA